MAGLFKKKPKKGEEQEQKLPAESGSGGPESSQAEPTKPKGPKKPLFGKKKKPAADKPPVPERPAEDKPLPDKPVEDQPRPDMHVEDQPVAESPVSPEPVPEGPEPEVEEKKHKKGGFFKRKRKDEGESEAEGTTQQVKQAEPPPPPEPKKKKRGSFGGSKYSPVGLDIGRGSIAAVRLQHQAAGSVIHSSALDQLPEGIINEGEVIDVAALAMALKNFWKTYKIRGRKVSLGLASQKVVVRTLDFPMLDKKELRQAIEYQAQDYIPIPIEEAVFDFHVMGRFTDEDGVEKQKVLVIAAQKVMVMNFIDAIKKAKLTIDGIDLQAFAMLRTFSTRSFLDAGAPSGQATAIVNVASDVTNMIIETNGEPQFTRITSFGGDDFTRAVQEQTGVSFAEAELLKAQVGLAVPGQGGSQSGGEALTDGGTPTDDGPGSADSGDDEPTDEEMPPQGGDFLEGPPGEAGTGPDEGFGAPPGDEGPGSPGELDWPEVHDEDEDKEREQVVRRALEITADSFAEELRRSLDYYMSQDDSLPIGRLLLSGGGSLLPNLVAHLSQIFPFPVELGNPLARITENKSDLSDDELRALAPRLAIAIGLALEDEE